MPVHVTLSGHEIRYEAGPELAGFLERARSLAENPGATSKDLLALVYGQGNPLLDRSHLREHGVVTAAVLDQPAFQVLQDLILRKDLRERGIEVETVAARFTMTVAEAAERLGVHVSAVSKAIHAGRLGSWVKGREGPGRSRQFYLDPDGLGALGPVGRRGSPPKDLAPLMYRVGAEKGAVLRLRYARERGDTVDVGLSAVPIEGVVQRWRRVAVLRGRQGKLRMLVIQPGRDDREIARGSLYVRGRFDVIEKVDESGAARAAWVAFRAV
jgi:excisionase family DNA binding protein